MIKSLFIAALAVVFGVMLMMLVLVVPTYLLWNWLCPVIFGLPHITLWQTAGLLVLSGFLVKSHTTSNSKS